eukprot:CFRG6671T1
MRFWTRLLTPLWLSVAIYLLLSVSLVAAHSSEDVLTADVMDGDVEALILDEEKTEKIGQPGLKMVSETREEVEVAIEGSNTPQPGEDNIPAHEHDKSPEVEDMPNGNEDLSEKLGPTPTPEVYIEEAGDSKILEAERESDAEVKAKEENKLSGIAVKEAHAQARKEQIAAAKAARKRAGERKKHMTENENSQVEHVAESATEIELEDANVVDLNDDDVRDDGAHIHESADTVGTETTSSVSTTIAVSDAQYETTGTDVESVIGEQRETHERRISMKPNPSDIDDAATLTAVDVETADMVAKERPLSGDVLDQQDITMDGTKVNDSLGVDVDVQVNQTPTASPEPKHNNPQGNNVEKDYTISELEKEDGVPNVGRDKIDEHKNEGGVPNVGGENILNADLHSGEMLDVHDQVVVEAGMDHVDTHNPGDDYTEDELNAEERLNADEEILGVPDNVSTYVMSSIENGFGMAGDTLVYAYEHIIRTGENIANTMSKVMEHYLLLESISEEHENFVYLSVLLVSPVVFVVSIAMTLSLRLCCGGRGKVSGQVFGGGRAPISLEVESVMKSLEDKVKENNDTILNLRRSLEQKGGELRIERQEKETAVVELHRVKAQLAESTNLIQNLQQQKLSQQQMPPSPSHLVMSRTSSTIKSPPQMSPKNVDAKAFPFPPNSRSVDWPSSNSSQNEGTRSFAGAGVVDKVEDYMRKIDALTNDLKERNVEIEHFKAKSKERKQTIKALEEDIENIRQELENAQIPARPNSYTENSSINVLLDNTDMVPILRKENDKLCAELDSHLQTVVRLTARITEKEENMRNLQAEVDDAMQRAADAESTVSTSAAEYDIKLARSLQETREAEQKYNEAYQRESDLETSLEVASSNVLSLEGEIAKNLIEIEKMKEKLAMQAQKNTVLVANRRPESGVASELGDENLTDSQDSQVDCNRTSSRVESSMSVTQDNVMVNADTRMIAGVGERDAVLSEEEQRQLAAMKNELRTRIVALSNDLKASVARANKMQAQLNEERARYEEAGARNESRLNELQQSLSANLVKSNVHREDLEKQLREAKAQLRVIENEKDAIEELRREDKEKFDTLKNYFKDDTLALKKQLDTKKAAVDDLTLKVKVSSETIQRLQSDLAARSKDLREYKEREKRINRSGGRSARGIPKSPGERQHARAQGTMAHPHVQVPDQVMNRPPSASHENQLSPCTQQNQHKHQTFGDPAQPQGGHSKHVSTHPSDGMALDASPHESSSAPLKQQPPPEGMVARAPLPSKRPPLSSHSSTTPHSFEGLVSSRTSVSGAMDGDEVQVPGQHMDGREGMPGFRNSPSTMVPTGQVQAPQGLASQRQPSVPLDDGSSHTSGKGIVEGVRADEGNTHSPMPTFFNPGAFNVRKPVGLPPPPAPANGQASGPNIGSGASVGIEEDMDEKAVPIIYCTTMLVRPSIYTIKITFPVISYFDAQAQLFLVCNESGNKLTSTENVRFITTTMPSSIAFCDNLDVASEFSKCNNRIWATCGTGVNVTSLVKENKLSPTLEDILTVVAGKENPSGEVVNSSRFAKNGCCVSELAIILPSISSRSNCASRPDALTSLLVKHVPEGTTEHTSQVTMLVAATDDVAAYALGCAIGRAYPLYTAKSGILEDSLDIKVAIWNAKANAFVSGNLLNEIIYSVESIRLCGRLVDTPCNFMHCDRVVEEAKSVVESLGSDRVSIEVIRGEELAERGFGTLYGVGKASEHPPAMIILKYTAPAPKQTVCWVGKGIVYDTGGLSIKSKDGMPGMKRDMGGAAACLAAFWAAGRIAPADVTLYTILCVAENSVSALATRPDDVHTSYSGKTVEINNTDAEGRLVLADGVSYATRHLNCDVVLDMATLTGAQGICTGAKHAAIMSDDVATEQRAVQVGLECGDLTYPVLYCPEFLSQEFTSSVADMKNSVKNRANAQASCAGQFIRNHVHKDYKGAWIHVDMAYPSFNKATERGTGYGVALLLSMFVR